MYMNTNPKQATKRKEKTKFTKKIKISDWQLLVLSLPAVIKVFIFSYLPMVGIVIAFKELNYADGLFKSPWVGFKNFEFFFKSSDAWRITRNTLSMNFMFTVFGTIFAVLVALMLNKISKDGKMKKFYQTTMFFPYFLSWVVVGFLLESLLKDYGFINSIFKALNLNTIDFYKSPDYWPAIIQIANIWKTVGYNSLIYSAVLLGIDSTYFEAARIDGATSWQITFKIQLPFLIPMIILMTILSIGNIFRADFGMFYFLPGARNTLTFETTDVIDTYVYRTLQGNGNMSVGAAIGLFQSLVGLILVLLTNYLAKKYDPEYQIF